MEWFNAMFRDVCASNDVEPCVSDDRLVLVCSRMPEKDVQDEIMHWVPASQPSMWVEDLKSGTKVKVTFVLGPYQPQSIRFRIPKNHHILLDVEGQEQTCFKAGNPLWGMVACILKQDAYVEGLMIRFNGKTVLDSENPEAIEEAVADAIAEIEKAEAEVEADAFLDEEPTTEPVARPVEATKPKAAVSKKVILADLKDGRFDPDKPAIPEGVDFQIELEAFLKGV
jgi:hypothetical protein